MKKKPFPWKDVGIIAMIILFTASAYACGGENTFLDFLKPYGMFISTIVCILWVCGGLCGYTTTRKRVGPNSLIFATLYMLFSLGTKLFQYKKYMQSPSDIADIAASIILLAAGAALFISKDYNKKDEEE